MWSEGRLGAQQVFTLVEEGCRMNSEKQVQLEAVLHQKVLDWM